MPDLAKIKGILAKGELPLALSQLADLLNEDPHDLEALYLQAVACRYARLYDNSLETLERLKVLAPSHSRAHQEEGHVYRDLGNPPQAIEAYGRAIALNPALASSMRESITLLQGMRRDRQAIALQVQLDNLLKTPQPLVAAMDLLAQNKLLKAETLCRNFLQQHPENVEGIRLLADIATRLGILHDAEFLLESAATFAPADLQVRMEYVQILRKRQKFQAALEQAQKLLSAYPENPQVKSLCAIEHMQTGAYDVAMSLLDQVLVHVPGDARTLVTYGHALKTAGRTEEAVKKYRAAIAEHPAHGESYYSLANLKVYRFDDAEVSHMQTVEADGNLGFMDRVYLNFALAKAYEDQAEYETAFAYYEQGNRLKKAQSRYDPDRMQEEMAETKAVCDTRFFADHATSGADVLDPIFILGLPRSGSTLLEQILSSHSQVDGTLELPNVLSLSQRLRRRSGSGYPAVLPELTADECAEFGRAYIEETKIHRAGAPFFIDKMPNNFRHIGLIKMILPNPKVIDARREPMACCFSGYKQLFAEGQEFSYDLTDVGRYYSDYVDLMSHWDDVLPGFVLRVQHEDVVVDLEGEVRRILDFVGLDFEEACLNFFETERNIRTPSSEQVRQPIFTDSLEQWRHFKPWLDPLKIALGE
ncbi:MAG: tetratricopeptide repeat protein [Pseudomonadales bacterium]|nr:tetratricopeptide repeat protein [Pseudomonadales bacterium]